ncbi:MAG: hypothetical protein JO115_14225 [Pseudonocardiales bacterium]|nr:hypothetical protein [Pseudonocardiales bacterium]
MNCAYCYLPGRKSKNEMSLPVARAIAEGINHEWMESAPLELVWHGGESLAVGPTLFEELLTPFTALQHASLVQHVIQTNATLITNKSCELLLKHDIQVGVSLDGPSTLNQNRVDWQGKPALTRIMNGIAKLAEHRIDFDVIAVIDQTAIDGVEQILDFLATLHPRSIALNLEEREGANLHNGSPSPHEARTLWRDVFTWASRNRSIRIREVDRLLNYLAAPPPTTAADTPHDPLPTVAWNGDVIMLSPELLGMKSTQYSDFIAGNVLVEPLHRMLSRVYDLPYVQEFQTGVRRCKQTCDFFAFCQGGQAGNRFFEHGAFSTTETHHCHITIQALVTGFADLAETEGKIA